VDGSARKTRFGRLTGDAVAVARTWAIAMLAPLVENLIELDRGQAATQVEAL